MRMNTPLYSFGSDRSPEEASAGITYPLVLREVDRVKRCLSSGITSIPEPSSDDLAHRLSLAQYQKAVALLPVPTEQQLANLVLAVRNNRDLATYMASSGFRRLVPVMLAHPHHQPAFDHNHLRDFGYVYYYCLNDDNFCGISEGPAFMTAILAEEILDNYALLPLPNEQTPEAMERSYQSFQNCLLKLFVLAKPQ